MAFARGKPMSHLTWTENDSVGIVELDEQHKTLLGLANKLFDVDAASVPKVEIFSTLNALINFARTHFETEEEYLRLYAYPALEVHRLEHERFMDEIFLFSQRLERNDADIHKKIGEFIKSWYGAHILNTDKEYGDFFALRGIVPVVRTSP